MEIPPIQVSLPASTQTESIKNLAAALCAALPNIPEIAKNRHASVRSKKGDDSSYKYAYADLSDILAACTKPMAEQGLCVVWSTTPTDRGAILSGILIHAGSGEWMKSSLAIPPMANPQEMGSMLAYLKRYIFGLLVPVAATEADDDGQRACKGQDDDEAAQAALLEAKRKDREEWAAKKKAAGQYTKVEPIAEEKQLAEAGLAPATVADATQIVVRGDRTTDNTVTVIGSAMEEKTHVSESVATPPPTVPKHLQDMMFALEEEGISIDKFVKWATSPRDYEKKGRLLPEGTKFENFTEDLIKAILQPNKWNSIRKHLK